jgi:hypothetical protein
MALNEDEQTEAVFKSSRTDVDPVSGNEVPPGSLPEEVRDDIPAMLSEGEYVVPADVLRFYGVKFFEDLRAQAKMGLAEMEANGRIGGEPIEEEGDDLPFSDEELMVEESIDDPQEEQMSAAFGGLVGYNEGGAQLDVFGSNQFQQDPNDPTQVIIGSQPGGTGYELVTYYGPNGEEVNIPFFNGMALGVIPAGYVQNKPQETTMQEVAVPDDDNFDAASAARARQRIAEAEKKEINFSNPKDVESAVDTYYSSQSILGKAGTAMFGIPGLVGAKLIGRYERGNLLAGIDKVLADGNVDDETKKALGIQRGFLEDRDSYIDFQEKQGKKFGFLDAIKSAFSSEAIDKKYAENAKNYKTNYDWKAAALGKWVDATNLVNSLGSDADPREWSEAIRAQSEASREASAAARAASGWSGGFFGSASNDEDDTPSNNNSPSSNTNTSTSNYSNTDSWEDDEGFGVG